MIHSTNIFRLLYFTLYNSIPIAHREIDGQYGNASQQHVAAFEVGQALHPDSSRGNFSDAIMYFLVRQLWDRPAGMVMEG